MADLNRAYQEQLQKGLGTLPSYTGPKTKGGAIVQGVGSTLGQIASLPQYIKAGTVGMLGSGIDYLSSPTDDFAEQIKKEQELADARREASLRMPMPEGIGRPMEIQEQMDIFQILNPNTGTMTTKQINDLSKELSKDKNLKPFPVQPKKKDLQPFPKKQAEQNLADANREASLDMPSELITDADPAEQLFSQAMTDYISQARTGAEDDLPEIGDIEDYKKKFAEATGVNISGKPDTSQALMAMGLALMQNRAGKGFNVGKILSAVGEAGEKAMPALEKARTEARNNVIAAGKFALTAQDADEKTRKAAEKVLMERGQFYVFEKGPKGKPYLNFDNGDLSYLNKSELNKLVNNKEFNDKYSFIAAKDYFDLQKESAAPKDFGEPYGKEKSVSLLGGDTEGVNPIYIVDAQLPDGNYKGSRKQFGYLQSNPESVVRNIVNEQQSILKEQKEFKSLIENVQSGVSIPKQIGSSIVQFGRNLGIDLGSGPTQIAQARKKLEKIQLLNATEILRESGKTLSDQDRERVRSFVGSITLTNADDALILQSIGRVYDIILEARQRDLDTAVSNLKTNFGIKFNAGTEKSSAITKEELEEINKTRQQNGLKPRTMDDYQ
jgi:hypothetical protein